MPAPPHQQEGLLGDVVHQDPFGRQVGFAHDREQPARHGQLPRPGRVHDHGLAQSEGKLELPREQLLLAFASLVQAQLPERDDPRIVEVARQAVEQVVQAVPGDPRRVHGERDPRADAGLPQALDLHSDQAVPVAPQLLGARSTRVVGAGHGGAEAEPGEGGQVGVAHSFGVEVEVDEWRRGRRHAMTLAWHAFRTCHFGCLQRGSRRATVDGPWGQTYQQMPGSRAGGGS